MATDQFTDSSKEWAVNEHAGKKLFVLPGEAGEQEVDIVSNTSTTLTVTPDLDPDPSTDDPYEIRYYYEATEYGIRAAPGKEVTWSGDLIVEGGGIIATGDQGPVTIPSGRGTRMMWIPSKGSFRAGRAGTSLWNEENIGAYSVAMGSNTTASGYISTAMGQSTIASGHSGATAMGAGTTASGGHGATAMGRLTTASGHYGTTAMGNLMTVSGNTSVGINLYGDTTARTVSADNVFVVMGGNVGINKVDPACALDMVGDIQASAVISAGTALYARGKDLFLGSGSDDGDWRIRESGGNLIFQKRESGLWVTKETISA